MITVGNSNYKTQHYMSTTLIMLEHSLSKWTPNVENCNFEVLLPKLHLVLEIREKTLKRWFIEFLQSE